MRERIIIALTLVIPILALIPLQLSATTISCQERIPMGRFKLTAYCPCCDCSEGYDWQTSSGKTAKEEPTIAVDPDVINTGSQVQIGDTVYIAEDCGGLVSGDHIDIFFDSHEDVEDFGVKYADVWILRGEWEQ